MYKMYTKEFSIFRLEAKQEMFNKIPKKYFFLFFFNNEDFSFFNWHEGRGWIMASFALTSLLFIFCAKKYYIILVIYLIPWSDSPAIKC